MIEQLIHRIRVRQAELQMAMAVGTPITWEAYHRMVGEHQGLQTTLDIIENMLDEEKNQD
jgi:hypothetical protein